MEIKQSFVLLLGCHAQIKLNTGFIIICNTVDMDARNADEARDPVIRHRVYVVERPILTERRFELWECVFPVFLANLVPCSGDRLRSLFISEIEDKFALRNAK